MKTRKFWNRIFPALPVLILAAFLCPRLPAANLSSFPDLLGFADKLFEDHDYYAAASEYKRLAFFFPEEAKRAGIDERICRVYFRAGAYSRLKEYIAENRLYGPSFQYLAGMALFLQGENELSAQNLSRAAASNLAPEKMLVCGLLQAANFALLGDEKRSSNELAGIPNDRQDFLEIKVAMKKDLDLYNRMPKKSPAFAAGISVIPGAGLMYAGSWAEGVGTLLAGAVSLYAGYENLRNKDWLNFSLWSGAFLFFYVRNFVSAWEKTKKYNTDLDSFLLKRLNDNLYFQRLLERYSMNGQTSPVLYSFSRQF